MTKKFPIPEELDALIQEYLTDGILTDKERQVILKKAVGMGLDRDEIDLYLDAQVQKIDQETDAVVRKQKSKSCPYCGAPVPQLADKCPECGQYITPEASKDLQEILENLEVALVDFKAGRDIEKNKAIVERYARKAKLYYSNNPKIKPLLLEINDELSLVERKIARESRNESIKSILSSRWLWLGIEIIVLALVYFYSFDAWRNSKSFFYEDDTLNDGGAVVFLVILIPEAVLFLYIIFKTAKWAANKGGK